jgi:hypothetical protein
MNYNGSELHRQCAKYRIEEIRTENSIIFFCPDMPDKKIKIELIKMIPKNTKYQFVIGPKQSTIDTLILMFNTLGINNLQILKSLEEMIKNITAGNRHIDIQNNNVQIPDDSPFWNEIEQLLVRDGFYKTWTITLGNKTITEKNIKIATEISKYHDIRDHAILEDDMVNLKISLGKEQDVLDFLKDLENETR